MARFGRGVLLLLLLLWSVRFITAHSPELVAGSFLHTVDLVFHEAGHVLFSPFGRFLTVLGGSLFQVLVPLICAIALYVQARDPFGASVGVWWCGQNLIDLAPYIGDARALQLPLLGGQTGAEVEGHDWETILQALGWLQYDRTLASAAHVTGSIVMIASLVYAGTVLLRPAPAGEQA